MQCITLENITEKICKGPIIHKYVHFTLCGIIIVTINRPSCECMVYIRYLERCDLFSLENKFISYFAILSLAALLSHFCYLIVLNHV